MNNSKEEILKSLTDLGYFKYVEANMLDATIAETFDDYLDDGVIQFSWEKLHRTFGFDAEFLFEANGIKSQIKGMLPLFKAMGIELNIDEYIEEFDGESYTKRSIKLNEKTYDTSGSTDWGTAFNAGFKLIDEILADHKNQERVFVLLMDETSMMILLDQPLFDYLSQLIPVGSTYRPVDIGQMMKEVDG